MFSVYRQERDTQGREVVQIGMDLKLAKALFVAAPIGFSLAGYFFIGVPIIVAALMMVILTAGFALIGLPALGAIARGSELRVALDSKAGRILVGNAGAQSEIRMADVANVEFGCRISSGGPTDDSRETTVYRLEFVMKNGERLPATAAYSSLYTPADQEKMVAAIKAALGRQMV